MKGWQLSENRHLTPILPSPSAATWCKGSERRGNQLSQTGQLTSLPP